MRLIDADELKKTLEDYEAYSDIIPKEVYDFIDNAPTVNFSLNLNDITEEDIVKFKVIWQRANSKGLLAINEDRQSGHWILEEEDCDNRGNNFYQCSNCFYHDTHYDTAIVPYCWHCGAYMLSEESGQEASNED